MTLATARQVPPAQSVPSHVPPLRVAECAVQLDGKSTVAPSPVGERLDVVLEIASHSTSSARPGFLGQAQFCHQAAPGGPLRGVG